MSVLSISPSPRQEQPPGNIVPFRGRGDDVVIRPVRKTGYHLRFAPELIPEVLPAGLATLGSYIALGSFAKDDGRTVEKSLTELSEEFNMSRRHVIRVLKSLSELGLVTKGERVTTKGDADTNLYHLKHHFWYEYLEFEGSDRGGDIGSDADVTTVVTQGSDMGSDIPPLEPPVRVSTVSPDCNQEREKTDTPKPPRQPSGPVQELIEAYRVAADLERIADYGRAAGQAKKLVAADVTADDIPSLYGYVVSWSGSADLGLLLGQVDRWRQQQKRPPQPPKGSNPIDDWSARKKAELGIKSPAMNGVVIDTTGVVR